MLSSVTLDDHCRLLLEEAANVLVLTDARRVHAYRQRAPAARIVTDAAGLEGLEGQFDGAVVEGLLENEPWDRWVLQRVHRVLRMNAPIVVVVPPLASLVSAIDLGFLAYAARKAAERLLQRWKPQLQFRGPVRRRYKISRLVRTMQSLGYTAIERGGSGPGGGHIGPPWLARRSALTARKASSISGVQGRRWPDAEEHRKRYAESSVHLTAARDAWLSGFPHLQDVQARPLEPSLWRGARVLVLAPHPDDELIGCGGTLCRLLAAGAEVVILQATDGSRLYTLDDLPEARRKIVRLEEAMRVAGAIGAQLAVWLQEDTRLRRSERTVAELARLLREHRPTHVFTPFLGDSHADHRTLSLIFADALAVAGIAPRVLQYEVWSLVPANLYCDITEQAQRLEELLLLYEHAMRADDFVHFCENRNLARALEVMGRPAYVEAFLSTSAEEYRRLSTPGEGG